MTNDPGDKPFQLFSRTRDLYVSGMLDGNRAYAAVLSGVMVGLVAIQEIDNPEQVFDGGIMRGAGILIGIASLTIVSDLRWAPELRWRGRFLCMRAGMQSNSLAVIDALVGLGAMTPNSRATTALAPVATAIAVASIALTLSRCTQSDFFLS